ncbi:putative ATP binding protein, partial [Toxoplasma gondii ARI]
FLSQVGDRGFHVNRSKFFFFHSVSPGVFRRGAGPQRTCHSNGEHTSDDEQARPPRARMPSSGPSPSLCGVFALTSASNLNLSTSRQPRFVLCRPCRPSFLQAKMKEHTELLCELIEDYNLVSFRLLDIQEKSSVLSLLKVIDLANGYSLGNMAADFNIFSVSLDNTEDTADLLDTIQERYVDLDEDDDPDKH